MHEECKLLLLSWSYELLSLAKTYLTKLATTTEMCRLVKAFCQTANFISTKIILGVCDNLDQLLVSPYTLCWNVSVYI